METPREPTPEVPVAFGRYQLLRRIGAGGMGEVFLAHEGGGNPRVVVVKKVLPSLVANRAFVGRFLDEAKVVVRLDHPNVARVHAMGEHAGEYFLSMEYVQGKTVSHFAKRLRDLGEPLPVGLALLLAERVCDGLEYAHQATDERGRPLQLVHRDLSPANVCISYAGEVKIIDFGAAHSALKVEQTAPRVVIGNLTYMAPEQARKRPLDGRADLYSCGVLLWELLAWVHLEQKGDPLERWKRAANPTWEAPSTRRPGLPPEVDALVLSALRTLPAERVPDAATFARALREARLRHAPGADEAALGALLSRAFSREKRLEDAVLKAAVAGRSAAEVPAGAGFTPLALAPPTALAFEHTEALAPPPGPAAAAAPGAPPPTPLLDLGARRTTFGVPLEGPLEDGGPPEPPPRRVAGPRAVGLAYGAAFALAVAVGFIAVWLARR